MVPSVLILIGCLILLRRRSGWVYLMLIGNIGSIGISVAWTVMIVYLRSGSLHGSGIDWYLIWFAGVSLASIVASLLFSIGFLWMAGKQRSAG
jgi:hypothetical protein